jgi:hypothetical protein
MGGLGGRCLSLILSASFPSTGAVCGPSKGDPESKQEKLTRGMARRPLTCAACAFPKLPCRSIVAGSVEMEAGASRTVDWDAEVGRDVGVALVPKRVSRFAMPMREERIPISIAPPFPPGPLPFSSFVAAPLKWLQCSHFDISNTFKDQVDGWSGFGTVCCV